MWKVLIFSAISSVLLVSVYSQDVCLRCTSSVIHPGCINPEVGDFETDCRQTNNRSCFTRVDENGHVVRGCLSQLDNSTANECDSETCQICIGTTLPGNPQACNSGIFPPHRLWCHICSGGVNSTCAGNVNTTTTVCPVFHLDDQCYVARPNGNYERGCLSSASSNCEDESCLACDGQGCNFEDFDSATSIFSALKISGLLFFGLVFIKINN